MSVARSVAGALVLLAASADLHAQGLTSTGSSACAPGDAVTRTVIEMLARDVRMATHDPTGTALAPSGPCCPGGSQGIVEARPNLLHFRQDLNGDGTIGRSGEDLIYSLVDGDIRRRDGAAEAQTLVGDAPASGLAFRYFDGATPPNELLPIGMPPALTSCQRDCIARVRITMHAEPPAAEATSEVAIRNRSSSFLDALPGAALLR